MQKKRSRFHIGLRTMKTVIAVIISMVIVNSNISPNSNLPVAMLAAMAAVQPTFKASWESSIAQVVGSIIGSVFGIVLMQFNIPYFIVAAIAVVVVITLYNGFRIPYAPSLPCLLVVILCTTPGIEPVSYAVGRLWDTCIGLGVGMIVNTLIFPYDNHFQIRDTIRSLDRDLILFLEDMFDGDNDLPNPDEISRKVTAMQQQLQIFANQKFLHRLNQREEVEKFRICEGKARELVARLELLSRAGRPGRLSEENRHRLIACGAVIRDKRVLDAVTEERDIVTNYHIKQILTLRRELLEALDAETCLSGTKK